MSKTEKRVALVANAYLLERDALRVELDAMRQRAEAAEATIELRQKEGQEAAAEIDKLRAALAAERARAEDFRAELEETQCRVTELTMLNEDMQANCNLLERRAEAAEAKLMTESRATHEAATIEAMHTGDCTPDLEYTPITAPLPRLVRREELDAARAEAQAHSEVCYSLAYDLAQAEAKLARVDEYAGYYRDAENGYRCGDETAPLDFAEWLAQQSEAHL